jgi:hypothetical protein
MDYRATEEVNISSTLAFRLRPPIGPAILRMKLDQITRWDLLWVGLILLGAYLVATGGIGAGSSGAHLVGLKLENPNGVSAGLRKDLAFESVIHGGLTSLAGAILILVAAAVCRSGARGPEADYSDARRRQSLDHLSVLTPLDRSGPAQQPPPPAQ